MPGDRCLSTRVQTVTGFPWSGRSRQGACRVSIGPIPNLRLLLEQDVSGTLVFKADPIELFEEKKTELSSTIRTALSLAWLKAGNNSDASIVTMPMTTSVSIKLTR